VVLRIASFEKDAQNTNCCRKLPISLSELSPALREWAGEAVCWEVRISCI